MVSGNELDAYRQYIKHAGESLDLDSGTVKALSTPDRVLESTLTIRMEDGRTRNLSAFRSQFDNSRGPYKGGVRYHPTVSRDDVVALSGLMAVKTAVTGIPYGGGKGGIAIDTSTFSAEELERVTRSYATEMRPIIGVDRDILAPDVNTGPHEMNLIKDTYETLENTTEPGVVTGKSISSGGSKGRVEATGRGVFFTVREAFDHLDTDLRGKTVAIQGFGNVGIYAAQNLTQAGAKIVAVSDTEGGVYDESGLEVAQLRSTKSENESVVSAGIGSRISNEALLTLDVDLLIPAALEDAITTDNVDSISADVIVEGANSPITVPADLALRERDCLVVPDVLANAGGVVVSYAEWVQNRQRRAWTDDQVDAELEKRIREGFTDVVKRKEADSLPDLRMAAYVIAIERIQQAMDEGGLWP